MAWRLMREGVTAERRILPMIGKLPGRFSNHWKICGSLLGSVEVFTRDDATAQITGSKHSARAVRGGRLLDGLVSLSIRLRCSLGSLHRVVRQDFGDDRFGVLLAVVQLAAAE